MNALLWSLTLFCVTANQVETSRTAETLLYIRTVPAGAEILLDGKPLGNSDGLFTVKPGTYKIVVDLEGHEPQNQQITIGKGRITRIELELTQSSLPKPKLPQTESNLPTTTVMLPDVDRRDCPTVLDLASGELIENIARDGDASGYIRLGKGDLWQDSGYFGTVRGARAMLWDGTQFGPFQAVRPAGGSMGYGKLTLPCRILVTTAEKRHYDVTILWMNGQGSARVDYRRAEPSVVPNYSSDDVAIPVVSNNSSNDAPIKATLTVIETAFERYRLDVGQYPTTAQGLDALVRQPQNMTDPTNWTGPYLRGDSILLDPWGQPYHYEYNRKNKRPRIWSAGPDHISETLDDIPPNDTLANRMKSATQLGGIGKAVLIYAFNHNDDLPPNLESLTSTGELHPQYLVSPRQPEGFAGPGYIYVDGLALYNEPADVVAYENPAYCQDGLNVLYLDSHVSWEKPDVFLQKLEATSTYKRLGRELPKIQFKKSDSSNSSENSRIPSDPQPISVDGTIFDMTINDLDDDKGHEALDLDKAKQVDFVPGQHEAYQYDLNSDQRWANQNGVDLFADYANNRWSLMASGLTLKRYLPNEFWDRLGPAEIQVLISMPEQAGQGIEILDRNGFRFYLLDRHAKTPLTFAFETREGGLGVLQIIDFLTKPKGIKIRYKLVKRPSK